MATKTLLKIVQEVTGELALPTPLAVLSSQDLTIVQLKALVTAAGEELTQHTDWQRLLFVHTFNTVNGQSEYAFPGDVKRIVSATAWDRTNQWPLHGAKDPVAWERLVSGGTSSPPTTHFRLKQNKIELYPTPGVTPVTIAFEYYSSNFIIDGTTGLPKDEFTLDSDYPVFDGRLMVFLTKLKWLETKGFDTRAAAQDYNASLASALGADTPAAPLSLAGNPTHHLVDVSNVRDGSWSV